MGLAPTGHATALVELRGRRRRRSLVNFIGFLCYPTKVGYTCSLDFMSARRARAAKGRKRLVKSQDSIRTRHDEWGKRALSLWCKELGDVLLDARIAGESRRGDVLFTERRGRPDHRRKLGVLGELARGRVLFELFRNPPTALELQSCILKVVDLNAQVARSARRAKQPRSSVEGALLCVITPGRTRSGVFTRWQRSGGR
ncbi:MAG: hypothetical protein L6Q76_04780 [Polyangiaceae bacterium]|nr:hypothetical protein [Polyangiaceae bacterium]